LTLSSRACDADVLRFDVAMGNASLLEVVVILPSQPALSPIEVGALGSLGASDSHRPSASLAMTSTVIGIYTISPEMLMLEQ
jgi:hypothetical protein